jgi:hypothetical protein
MKQILGGKVAALPEEMIEAEAAPETNE